ncbi:MAG: hypothetical protein BGP13_11585 [Sphingobacteriales bacterium 40-81]|nr:MAG: hypothetical protein BGP13_11585 [Sphingobacteriales bacterium 40-81]
MSLKNNIKKYYLVPAVAFLVPFLLGIIFIKSPNSFLVNLLIIFSGALISSLLAGTIYYLQDTKWGPAKREKRFSKSPFRELLLNGFTRENNFVIGYISKYPVIIIYNWGLEKPSVNIHIFFNSHYRGRKLAFEDTAEIEKRNLKKTMWSNHNYFWRENSIAHFIAYNFSPPDYEKVLSKADEIINMLRNEALQPININEAKKYFDEERDKL